MVVATAERIPIGADFDPRGDEACELAKRVAVRFQQRFAPTMDWSDFVGVAWMACEKAHRKWNGGGTLGAYLVQRMQWACFDAARDTGPLTRAGRFRMGHSLDVNEEEQGGLCIFTCPREADPATVLEQEDLVAYCWRILQMVGTPYAVGLCRRIFVDGVRAIDVATERNVTQSAVSATVHNALRHLRRAILTRAEAS